MKASIFDKKNADIAWCPGCGNFKILEALKGALLETNQRPENLVVVSGIGQAPKTPQYFNTHMFNGLHGRALPVATGVKAANPSLTVIAQGGDGDMYGEGGNHFLHTIRRNPDIVHLVHNNMVYGLTKGQASPTSQKGFRTPVQVEGVFIEPVNPVAVAIAQNASFVARAFAGDVDRTKALLVRAIRHQGYALVDIFQPCVTFNKVNTFKWFKDHVRYLDENYDPSSQKDAFELALQNDPFLLGVLYVEEKPAFHKNLPVYDGNPEALYSREIRWKQLKNIIRQRQYS